MNTAFLKSFEGEMMGEERGWDTAEGDLGTKEVWKQGNFLIFFI